MELIVVEDPLGRDFYPGPESEEGTECRVVSEPVARAQVRDQMFAERRTTPSQENPWIRLLLDDQIDSVTGRTGRTKSCRSLPGLHLPQRKNTARPYLASPTDREVTLDVPEALVNAISILAVGEDLSAEEGRGGLIHLRLEHDDPLVRVLLLDFVPGQSLAHDVTLRIALIRNNCTTWSGGIASVLERMMEASACRSAEKPLALLLERLPGAGQYVTLGVEEHNKSATIERGLLDLT
ncbi:MAG: hypothetical protein HY815_25085 [Candidatus Riflebacteria bacterium]|nr:hypothetical protein [Candidatus Riflebacteria bacterium]